MTLTLSLKEKRIPLLGNSREGTIGILKLWDEALQNQENLTTLITQGENRPGDEKTNTDGLSRVLKALGGFADRQLGSSYRESRPLDLELDESAHTFFMDHYHKQLSQALKKIGKTNADIDAEEYRSEPLLIYHLLSRAAAQALSKNTDKHHDGTQLCAAMREFCEKLCASDLLSGSSGSSFANFLSIEHKTLLSQVEVIVKVVQTIRAPETAFKETQDQLQALKDRIMRIIAATLDKNLGTSDLRNLHITQTLEDSEKKILLSTRGSVLPALLRNELSPAQVALPLDVTARREAVLSSLVLSRLPVEQKALKRLYELLDQTSVLCSLVGSLGEMVALTSWVLFVTKAIDIRPLIELLEAHWKVCNSSTTLDRNHYLFNTKVWSALQQNGAVGSLLDLDKSALDKYAGLATLAQDGVRVLLLETLKKNVFKIQALCSKLEQDGSECRGLLRMEVLSVLGSAVALSPAALPVSGGWDEKEQEQFVRVNSSRPVRPVLSSNALMNTEPEIKKIAQDSGLEEKELPPVPSSSILPSHPEVPAPMIASSRKMADAALVSREPEITIGQDSGLEEKESPHVLGNSVSASQPEMAAPVVAFSRNVADEEKKLASDFGYHPERYKDLQLKQLSGGLQGCHYNIFEDLLVVLQSTHYYLYTPGIVAGFWRGVYWNFTETELTRLGDNYRELVWWLVVLTGADVSTLSIGEVSDAQTTARRGGPFPILANMMGRLKYMQDRAPERISTFDFYQMMKELIAKYDSTLTGVDGSEMLAKMDSSSTVAVNRILELRNELLERQLTEADQRAAEADQRAAEADQRAAEAKQETAEATQKFTKLEKTIEEMKDDRAKDQVLWTQNVLKLMDERDAAKRTKRSKRHSERDDSVCLDDEEKAAPPPPTTTLYTNARRKPVPDEPTEDSVVDLESGPKNRN